MKRERIKSLFFSDERLPFPSSELWQLLGYTRHRTFVRFLMSDAFNGETRISRGKIGERKGDVHFIGRKSFYQLVVEKNVMKDTVEQIYLEWKACELRKDRLKFKNTGKRKIWRKNLHGLIEVTGKFYEKPLDTALMAQEIECCPYELFDFFSKKHFRKENFKGVDFYNKYQTRSGAPIPFYYFDSPHWEERHDFLSFIEKVQQEFPLDEFQKKLIIIYLEVIKELLDKQQSYDVEAGRMGKTRYYSFYFNPKESRKEVTPETKEWYRKTAILCHPDKHQDELKKIEMHEVFINLQSAYEVGNLNLIKNIYRRLTNTMN